MKKILQYVFLLTGAVFISKFSFEFLFAHPTLITSLSYVSIILAVGVACLPNIFFRFRNKTVTYFYFILSIFVFTLLMGSYLTIGPAMYAYFYFIALLCSIYQLYRVVRIIKVDEEVLR